MAGLAAVYLPGLELHKIVQFCFQLDVLEKLIGPVSLGRVWFLEDYYLYLCTYSISIVGI